MKKQFVSLFAIGLIIISHCIYAGPSTEQLELALTGAHTLVFDKGNLITERRTPENSLQWDKAVAAIGTYISDNAPDLKGTFAQLNTISTSLVNTLQSSFGAYIAPNLIKSKKQTGGALEREIFEPGKLPALKFDKLAANLKPLEADKARTIQIQKDLDKSQSTVSKLKNALKTSNADAKKLLKRLALTLELTLAKVQKDFDKLKALSKITDVHDF